MSGPAANDSPSRRDLWGWAAAGWLVGFSILFYRLPLPNNPEWDRPGLWLEVPWLLLELVLPVSGDEGPPSGWAYFPQRLDLLLVAGIILAGAWGAGHLILRLVRPPLTARCAERTVFAFGLGLSALSLLTLGCGLAGLLSRPLLGGFIILCALAECMLRLRLGRGSGSVESDDANAAGLPLSAEDTDDCRQPPAKWLRGVCLVAMAVFLVAMLFGAMSPPVDFDVKEYHLQGPKEFFQNGRITFLPHNVYTSFPFLTEMLSLLAMVLRGDWFRGALAGKVVLGSFAPLTALGVYAAGRRWFNPAAGWLAALVFLSTPWVYRISIIAYAEGGLTFYLFTALLAAMIGIERLGKAAAPGMFLLAGLLAGSATACKYPAALTVVLPLGIAVVAAAWMHRRSGVGEQKSGGRAGRALVVFAAGTVLTVGSWLLKNTVETGNPVYPLLYSVFGGRDWDADLDGKWTAAHSPDTYAPSQLAVNILDVAARNDWHSGLLFGLAPLALLFPCRRSQARWLWLYVLFLFIVWWGLTHRIDRFWVPMIPVVALLAGAGAACRSGRLWGSVCGICLAAGVLFNLALSISSLGGYNAWLTELSAARRQAVSPPIRFLNENLPDGSKVLCVGEAAVFYAEFPLVYNTVFDRSIFRQWCAEDRPGTPAAELSLREASEIRQTFREQGITHVYANWSEILRYRTSYGYTDFVAPARFKRLREIGVLGEPRALGYRDYAKLGKKDRREIDRWGAGLKVSAGPEREAVIAAEVYPVRP